MDSEQLARCVELREAEVICAAREYCRTRHHVQLRDLEAAISELDEAKAEFRKATS